MRKYNVFLVVMILLFACEQEDDFFTNDTCKQSHFYYAFDEKCFIDSLLQDNYLLIGFYKSHSDEEINSFLNRQHLFHNENVVEIPVATDYDYKLLIREFKTPRTCREIEEIIEQLERSEIVAFAAHTYEGQFCIGWTCTELMSYSNEIVVSLNDSACMNDFYSLIENTNTWIVKETKLYILIGSDKTSQGSALELANFFYETGLFHYSHPNFHYFDID